MSKLQESSWFWVEYWEIICLDIQIGNDVLSRSICTINTNRACLMNSFKTTDAHSSTVLFSFR